MYILRKLASCCRRYFALLFGVTLILSSFQVYSQDSLKNIPELSMPLLDKKLVVAHCMTHIIRYQYHGFEDGCNSAYYPVTNNASSSIGGYTQVNVISDNYLKDSSLDQAVEFEMRAAKRCGIDGFQFYYPLGNSSWDNIIKAYFRVADQKNIDFKFTFCISHPSGSNEASKIGELSSRINGIMSTVGKTNSHWLRTPDGRLIVYMWYGEQLADIPSNLAGYSSSFYVARAYRKLANAVGEKFACIYSLNDKVSTTTLNEILDYFPSVWLWTQAYTYLDWDATVAGQCQTRNRAYAASAFPDFYTSKLLQPGTWNILSVSNAVSAGINRIERKYMVTGLSQTFRKQLAFAVNKNVPLINVITWNDYPEGHHLAPEVNHNFGFSILLQYYKSLWQGVNSPYQNKDVAITFFKKYKNGVVPSPYKISLVNLGNTVSNAAYDDSVEVVTILPSAAQLIVNGSTVNVPAGLSSKYFASQPGAVSVTVSRNGSKTCDFVAPEWITNAPVRTDKLTYSFDSEFSNFYKDIFGNTPPIYSVQYNPSPGTVPVKLTWFSVINKDDVAHIEWQTSEEINTAYYNVQRSVGNQNSFTTIGKIRANGNSSFITSYKLNDNIAIQNSDKIFYRLEILGTDGAVTYSDIKVLRLEKFSTLSISPNPAEKFVNIKGNNLTNISVSDITGKLVYKKSNIKNDNLVVNVSDLQPGMYIVTSQDNDENIISQNLIVK